MESICVETHFLKDECDNHVSSTSIPSTAACCSTSELAVESTLQAIFAEKTAQEMKEVMDYWKATVNTTPTLTSTCSMPHNSLTVQSEEEEEAAGSIMDKHDDHDDDEEDTASVESSGHDHGNGDHNDTVASSYSGSLEQQQQQQAPQMPPRNVLFSRELHGISTSSNLSCVTNLLLADFLEEDEDDHNAEFSCSLYSSKGGKQLCDNTSTTTASTHIMMNSTYSCDASTCESCSCCCHHQLASFPPLSTTTTTCTAAAFFWSDDNHSIHSPPTGGEKENYPPVILLPPPLLVSHQRDASGASSPSCSSSVVVEHFHWTACQQQTQVNLACSRAQWMADSLAALVNNHDNLSNDDAPAATSCNRDAAQQPLLLLMRLLKHAHLQLRLACRRIANELYIGFCQALPLEYLRLWVYLWHLIHSYLPPKTADNNNNKNVGTSSDHFAKKTLKRDLIMTSLLILAVAIRIRLQSSLQQPQHDDTTTTPCLVCFQPDDTLSSQPSFDAATTLPFRTLYFETVHYPSGLSSSLSEHDDLLRL